MLEPIVVTISHQLGRDAARRRIEDGLTHIHGQQALIGAVVDCLSDHPPDKSSLAQRRHAAPSGNRECRSAVTALSRKPTFRDQMVIRSTSSSVILSPVRS